MVIQCWFRPRSCIPIAPECVCHQCVCVFFFEKGPWFKVMFNCLCNIGKPCTNFSSQPTPELFPPEVLWDLYLDQRNAGITGVTGPGHLRRWQGEEQPLFKTETMINPNMNPIFRCYIYIYIYMYDYLWISLDLICLQRFAMGFMQWCLKSLVMSVPIRDGLHPKGMSFGCWLGAAALLDRDFMDFHLYNIYIEREIIHHTNIYIYMCVIYIDYHL